MPRIAFDFIEGGVEDEHCLAANEQSFARHRLVPRYMVDIARRDESAALFGQSFASPFGIAPTGLAALFRADADLILARAAAAANIPFIMSGASTASIEAAAAVAPAHIWYQLYAARDRKICADMIRARATPESQHPGADGRRARVLQARAQRAQWLRARRSSLSGRSR